MNCKNCGGRVSHNSGIVCANFGYPRGHFSSCQRAWHARCYRIERDPFPRGLTLKLTEDLGEGVEAEEEGWDLTEQERHDVDSLYLCARPGDHFMAPFQCELCLFRNIYKRNPVEVGDIDQWVLTCLRRANLDAFWQRASSTVENNLREARHAMRCAQKHGISDPLKDFLRGPFPLQDLCGAEMAIALLE